MGKRKFDSESTNGQKKPKVNAQMVNGQKTLDTVDRKQPQNDTDGVKNNNNLQNRSDFDIKHFRKELSTKQGQTMALTQFLQVCLNPDSTADYLLEYLKNGGNSHEILRQITQDSKRNLTLTTPAFHIFHMIILKVQSSLPHMIAITEEACRYFLNTFMSTVEIMISENSGPRHRKIILKLLTSMVTLNSDLGIEMLNQAPLTPKHLQHVVEKANFKEKDNVRTSFVHFMTSFLVDGNLPLIKALLEKQGLLALVIPGLINDEAEATLIFLSILKKNVIDNAFISKSLKLKTFSHQVLHNLFKVFSWKGPPELSQQMRSEARPEIMSLLSEIILTLFTSHKLGLYFIDKSLGTVDVNKNQNLYKALLSLKRPWENEYECDVILNIIYKCPDLHRAIFSVIEQSFEPQHSPIWEKTTDFIIKLFIKLKPEDMVSRMSNLNPIQVANFIRFITLPVSLLKYIHLNLGKDLTVSLYCVRVLVKMLQVLKRYLQILDISGAKNVDLLSKLEYFIPKHLPAPTAIVHLINNVISKNTVEENTKDYKLPKINDTEALTSLLDLLLLYNEINPPFFETLEGTINMKLILDYSKTLTNGHVPLLKFKVVSLWLTVDNSAVSLKNSMFKELFLIMLDVYMSDDDETWIEAKDTLRIFFKNTSIFEGDEDEIDLMLYTLRNCRVNPPSIIGDIVEYVLENITNLTEYIRNQLVNFEITSKTSEENLNNLFNGLMEDKNTEDCIFLESKMPSPFIVGCMQYLQLHRDTKKILKQFLSIYITNLLHSNYSPELTEVLMSDSKLDARFYITSWLSTPVSIPESIAGRDNILKAMSKIIIDGEQIPINDVFQYLEAVNEDGDITINNKLYKIGVVQDLDSSELLIWSKYLIYCIIRLTNMAQLSEEQQKKITDLFQCLIAIASKHLRLDVCRTIILTMFKNPHFLKVYKLINTGRDSSSILATNFLLEVITKQKDIVDNLQEKYKILKSYQQKNYNEIVKAFIKINKRKSVDSQYTLNVLQVTGLSNDDDLKVLNLILTTETDACFKDDKEPSIVLDLLRYLIVKYSKSISLDFQPNSFKKVISLYTALLSKKHINPNLITLENALIQYFENKPQQISRLSDEDFKPFFQINLFRKSTANLAAILLKYNPKFCKVFKEEIARPEILAQREITLPLGNAIINHNQFLLNDKDLLPLIYNEYKSNIIKLLEKPHKAGQIYMSCSQFIRKIVIECMDIEDVAKFYNKSHKFEIVEVRHVQLLQSLFLKLCIQASIIKTDHVINYLLSMLHLTSIALKDRNTEALQVIIETIYNVNQAFSKIEGLNMNQIEYSKITESATWQNFCKATLKDCLKVKTVEQGNTLGPKILALLTNFVKLLYPEDHNDITTLFDMVTSHSEFLNVMLSYHSSDVKSRLLEFIFTLIVRNKSVMKSQQIPVFLSAYHATRSTCDRLIVAILHYYETNGLPVNEYKPYVFGDSAANFYAVRKNRSASLWSHPTPNQVLNLFDKEIIERTVKNFPVTLKFNYQYEFKTNIGLACEIKDSIRSVLDEIIEAGVTKSCPSKDNEATVKNIITKGKYENTVSEFIGVDLLGTSNLDPDDDIYDPMFLFPLLSHLLVPGSVASCFKILRSGLLSVPVMALSSHCPLMRAAAYHVLHRFYMLLETETRHKNDKLFLTDFINTLRQSLTTAINDSADVTHKDLKNLRLPAISAMYLARALMVSTAPFDPLYKPVNNFLIAKQFVDLTVVPDFLNLFHDSDVESADRRLWILEVIKYGTKTMTDINIVFKTMSLKMIMDFYSSVLSDRKAKENILGVLSAIVAVPRAFEILVEGHGLISWLHSVVRQTKERGLIKEIFKLIKNMIYSTIVAAFSRNIIAKGGKVNEFIELRTNKDVEHEILVIHYDLLKHIDDVELEDIVDYVKIYKLVSKRALKSLSKKQILCIVNKIGDKLKCSEAIRLLTKSLLVNDIIILKSRNLDLSFNDEVTSNLIKILTEVVQMYII